MSVRYKFVEIAPVTDDKLETAVNRWVSEGWSLDAIHFAMRDGSHRPAMAFVSFLRDAGEDGAGSDDAAGEGAGSAGLQPVD